jgi:uncharacterized membrane protein (DUF485 family)
MKSAIRVMIYLLCFLMVGFSALLAGPAYEWSSELGPAIIDGSDAKANAMLIARGILLGVAVVLVAMFCLTNVKVERYAIVSIALLGVAAWISRLM